MPLYVYQARQPERGCDQCRAEFEMRRSLSDPPLTACPACGSELAKILTPPAIGASKSTFDSRAKSAGFHKFQRLGKGEYEKKY